MSKERRPGNGHDEPVTRLSDLDDEQLLAALREALGASDPPPSWCVELAKESFALRTIDAELAALTEDSALDGAAPARTRARADSAPRFAVFDADSLNVEIEMTPGSEAGSWQLVGQLTPPAAAIVGVRRPPDDQTRVTADNHGRFMIDQLPSGPLSLAIEVEGRQPIVTEWITVG
ncbi:MAG TPA: carboxypeptidase-like regulatory domain-containing protein [Trebonia sp.]|nr:carboxypeptidase-like regulatory domain-containing protein [Trebonia sp.]